LKTKKTAKKVQKPIDPYGGFDRLSFPEIRGDGAV
jgi:hypothetical protein